MVRGLVTTGDTPGFDNQADLFGFAARFLLHELQHDRAGGAGLVPNVARLGSLAEFESRGRRRVERIEDFGIVMGGDLFRRHLSFGITSLPPRKMSRIIRSCGTDRISRP